MTNIKDSNDMNRDPISGAPGAHPVGTGLGAAAGATAGAAVGSVAGPVGTVVGGAIGAVVGGLGGKAAGEAVNPTAENAYWEQNYKNEPLVWQFDFTRDVASSLIVKLPARGLTFIVLANSDGLTRTSNLAAGDAQSSPFVKLFLRFFAP